MTITVTRKTNWIGLLGSLAIKINGEKVAKIESDQHLEIKLPSQSAKIRVSQWGIKSNELEVVDGDFIIIHTSKWNTLFTLLTFTLLVSLPFFTDWTIKGFILILLAILAVTEFFIEGYHITKNKSYQRRA